MTDLTKTWPFADQHTDRPVPACHVWLRLLETTDVHAHLMSYDYDRGQETPGYGLVRTATLIKDARAEAPNSLLFDNGDFLQGSALSDLVARPGGGWDGPHPVMSAMNSLDYDAACLGNHEFNFGLDWLRTTLSQARFPVVCANAVTAMHPDDPAQDTTFITPQALLPCTFVDAQGTEQSLCVGVIGFLPPQITTWDHTHLQGRLQTRGIVETARARVPRLRQKGADVVIALAHTGISIAPCHPDMEHAALALAEVPGIDAVLAGHSHAVFPDRRAHAEDPRINHQDGTLAGVPAVMAGFRGSHLGVLDLCLAKDEQGWHAIAHHAEARAVQAEAILEPTPPDATLMALVSPVHDVALRVTAGSLGHIPKTLHSYLAKAAPCPALAPVLHAKRTYLADALQGTCHSDLPVLATATSFKTGGQAGPTYFTHVPAGPVSLRNVSDLYPFPNTLIGLRLTGADLTDWLERAASAFCQIQPGVTHQPLWNPAFAGHSFDRIAGLSYEIDLSQPPRYDQHGMPHDQNAHRIRNLTFDGRPLVSSDAFALATNNFRAFGGGPYKMTRPDQVILESNIQVRDLLTEAFREGVTAVEAPVCGTWRFVPMPGTSILLDTSPEVQGLPDDLAALDARAIGMTDDGFLQLEIPL